MARTSNQRLEFWQFEVALFNDMKMVDLNEKYGTLGEAVYFRILSYIADSEGYYAVLSDSLVLSIYRSIGSKWLRDKRVILRIIDYCGVCGLFDVNLLRQNVITSCGIQRRWLYAKEKARAKGFTTDKFWLLTDQGFGSCTQNKNKCSNNDDKCSNNADKCDNNLPYISKVKRSKETPNPLQGNGEKNWKDRFFEKYTVFERKNYNDEGIDYEVLYKAFEKSTTLQKLWSFPKVIKIYEQIKAGVYMDKKTSHECAINAIDERAERERYYSTLRAKAEKRADSVKAILMKDKTYFDINGRLGAIEIAIARAVINDDEAMEARLLAEKEDLIGERSKVIERYGFKDSDLIPAYKCEKCSDTGWLESGRACDCYDKKSKGETI